MRVLREKILYIAVFCIIAVAAWYLLGWLWNLVTSLFAVILLSSFTIWALVIAIIVVLLHFKLLGALFSWVWSKNH